MYSIKHKLRNKILEKLKKHKEIEEQEPPSSLVKEALIFLWEIAKVIVVSLAIIIPIRYFLIQPFYVKGASMEPNFFDHEYLIVDQITYRFSSPSRGDVVVFRYPRDPREFFIKRVIGLPGEKIIVKNNKILVYSKEHEEGAVLEEQYLPEDVKNIGNVTETIGDDEYFLMGDNRSESLDSRVFGPIQRKSIVGKVFFRGWPLNRIGIFLDHPQYEL